MHERSSPQPPPFAQTSKNSPGFMPGVFSVDRTVLEFVIYTAAPIAMLSIVAVFVVLIPLAAWWDRR